MFNYKVYDISWAYKFTINIDTIKNLIKFTGNINSWQWQCTLRLDYKFDNTQIVNTDVIKIFKSDVLIYTWIVQDIFRNITNSYEEIELPLLWLGTLGTYILYRDGWSGEFNKTQDPADTIKEIIDYINATYTGVWLNYDITSIEDYWSSVSLDFDYDNCFEALQKCIEITDFWFFIDKDWKVYFQSKPSTATHTLTVWKDIESITYEEDSENLVNKLRLVYSDGNKTYEDVTSQTTYWLREINLNESDIVWVTSADIFWANYINTNKDPIQQVRITVNKNFDIESIKVLDTIRVLNFDFTINNLQVVKYSYDVDKLSIDLENFDSFGKEIN